MRSAGEAHDIVRASRLGETVPDALIDEEAERLTRPPPPRTAPRRLSSR